jgi:hypothetical protein
MMPSPFLKASLILGGTLLISRWIVQMQQEWGWFTLLPEQGMIEVGLPSFKGIISCRRLPHINAFIRRYPTGLAARQ